MEPEKKTILMLGTFDSKGNEFQYLYEELLRRGVAVMTMDVGVFKPQGHFSCRYYLRRSCRERWEAVERHKSAR